MRAGDAQFTTFSLRVVLTRYKLCWEQNSEIVFEQSTAEDFTEYVQLLWSHVNGDKLIPLFKACLLVEKTQTAQSFALPIAICAKLQAKPAS